MNVDDLVHAMHEHADRDPMPAPRQARIRSIERKVRRGRRRRLTAASAAIAIVVGLVLGVPPALSRRSAPLPAATPIKTINGYAEYADGGHLLATATGGFDQPLVMTIPAQSSDVFVVVTCDAPATVSELGWFFYVAGKSDLRGDCVRGDVPLVSGAALQRAVTLTVKFDRALLKIASGESKVVRSLTGSWSAAAYVKIPASQFPFPPRPKTLPRLSLSAAMKSPNLEGLHPPKYLNGTGDQTLTYTFHAEASCGPRGDGIDRICLLVYSTAQTPGTLHVLVDGAPFRNDGFFDYTAPTKRPTATDADLVTMTNGHEVTVTITAEGMTGAWQVAVVPAEPNIGG